MNEEGIEQKSEDKSIDSLKEIIPTRMTKIEHLFDILKRYDTTILQVNSKASFLIGITGVVLVALISQLSNQKSPLLLMTECVAYPMLNDWIFLLLSLSILTTLFFSLLVVFPITSSGNKQDKYTSFVTYSSVAKMPVEGFLSRHRSDDYDLWSDLMFQIHINAGIANTKYNQLKIAVWGSIISVIILGLIFIRLTIVR